MNAVVTALTLLSGDHRLLAPDSRGHGGTDNPGGRLSYQQPVITGDGDELADPAQAQRLFEAIPAAQLGIVPDAGHGAADEPIFWQIVRRFVAGLPAGSQR